MTQTLNKVKMLTIVYNKSLFVVLLFSEQCSHWNLVDPPYLGNKHGIAICSFAIHTHKILEPNPREWRGKPVVLFGQASCLKDFCVSGPRTNLPLFVSVLGKVSEAVEELFRFLQKMTKLGDDSPIKIFRCRSHRSVWGRNRETSDSTPSECRCGLGQVHDDHNSDNDLEIGRTSHENNSSKHNKTGKVVEKTVTGWSRFCQLKQFHTHSVL